MSKGVVGYNAALYITGTSTGMTDEACTEVSGTVFQVTNAAKRIVDDAVAVVVKVDTVVQGTTTYSLDYNTGIITFTSSQTGSTITITANYLPRHLLVKIQSEEFAGSWEVGDSTCQGDGAEDLTLLIQRCTMSVEAIQLLDEVFDGGSVSLDDVLVGKLRKVIEYQMGGSSGRIIRARVVAVSATIKNNGAAGMAGSSISFRGDVGDGTLVSVIAAA